MNNIESQIEKHIAEAFSKLFGADVPTSNISLQPTRKDFEGNFTFVTFPFLKFSKKNPEETGKAIGTYLKEAVPEVSGFNVVKGFLNLSISHSTWADTFQQLISDAGFAQFPAKGKKVMVEFSSPNTNKPLHLGHLRNNFLGDAVSRILAANGFDVMKTNLVNDRGIHICKSMIAYEKFGNGEAPTETVKGDKLVGNYYVAFDKAYKQEISDLLEKFKSEEGLDEKAIKAKAEKEAPLIKAAQTTLKKWEEGDTETVALWKKMNQWVYDGFDQTYKLMGIAFDKIYHESDTYLLGKDIVDEGLEKGIFFKKDDGSVWIDLSADGLDEKLLLRSDGTSVYMTQDMGTADLKFQDFPMQQSVYVVGNEQDYHFKVLKLIMQKLGRDYADGIYHLSYGMVDLPSGKMKSREGTVVDADDLIRDMREIARERTQSLGKADFEGEEAERLYLMLALGALKYYLLRVEPKRRMLFNPEESIDFHGNTGVYIQYNHARLKAIIRKAERDGIDYSPSSFAKLENLAEVEIELIAQLKAFPDKIAEAANNFAPSVIANYAYDLAKLYSKLYAELPIFSEPDQAKLSFRVALSGQVASVIKKACGLLGIEVPEKM